MVRHALLVLCLATSLAAPPAAAQLAVGDPAPDFTLFDTDGVQRSLSDYDDTVVVLFFVGWG